MKVVVFSTKSYDRDYLTRANEVAQHELVYLDAHLSAVTAPLAQGAQAVCAFVNDHLRRDVLLILKNAGVRLIALRCAGFNNVDLVVADELGIQVARVPAYSPHAVAEHAVALLLSLNRRIPRAYSRVREGNFSLQGLVGFDLKNRTVGVIGTGKIGAIFAQILQGFGCRVIAHDKFENVQCREGGIEYVSLDELFSRADIVSLHCPLTLETQHLIDERALGLMKRGVYIINTSRGGLVDTRALIGGLKSGLIGGVCLDVYEEEEELFFEDLSTTVIQDDVFMRLLTFPNVLITAHQGFLTEEALENIANTTIGNLTSFENGSGPIHRISSSSASAEAPK